MDSIRNPEGFQRSPGTARTHPNEPPPRLLASALYNAGAWGVTVVLAVVFTPYIVSRLTLENYGVYVLFTGLMGYYALLDFGTGQSLVKFLAEHLANRDYDALNRSLNSALSLHFLVGGLASGVLVVYADPILVGLGIPLASRGDARAGMLACAIGFFFHLLSGTLKSVLFSMRRFDVASQISVARDAFVTLGVSFVLYLGGQLKAALFATAALSALPFFFYVASVARHLPQWRISFTLDNHVLWRLLTFSVYAFIAAVAQSSAFYLMRFLLSAMAGPAAVAHYTAPSMILVGFGGFLSSGIGVLLPFTSEKAAHRDGQALREGFLRAAKLSVLIGLPIMVALALFSRPVLEIWMGAAFAQEAWLTMRLLCVASLFNSLGSVAAVMSLGLGHVRPIAGYSLVAMLLTLGAAVPLIPWAGAAGAALAAALASPVWIVFSFRAATRYFGVDAQTHFNRVYRFHAVAGIPLLAAVALALSFRLVEGFVQLGLALGGTLLTYYSLVLRSKWLDLDEVRQLMAVRGAG